MKIVREGMAPKLTVATTSLMSEVANIEANLNKAAEVIARAAASGAAVIVFPELFLTGYSCGEVEGKFFELAEPIPGPSTEALVRLAAKHNIYVAIGLPEANQEYPGIIHNSAVFLGPEGIVQVYRKVHLPTGGPVKELYWGFAPGDECPVFTIKQNWKIGMSLCYDTFFPELPKTMAMKGMDLLITLSAGPSVVKDWWYLVTPVRAIENRVFHIFSNLVGSQWGDFHFFGGAMIVSPDGMFLAKGKIDEEDLVFASLEATDLFEARKVFPTLRDRRPSAYEDIISTKYPHM